LGFSIKRGSWDLEDLKERHRLAREELDRADEALKVVEANIAQAEKLIFSAINGEENLDLHVLQMARSFLEDEQKLRKSRYAEWQRADLRSRQSEHQLKQAALYIEALKQVKDKSDREISQALEKSQNDQNIELWLQRYGRGKWQTYC